MAPHRRSCASLGLRPRASIWFNARTAIPRGTRATAQAHLRLPRPSSLFIRAASYPLDFGVQHSQLSFLRRLNLLFAKHERTQHGAHLIHRPRHYPAPRDTIFAHAAGSAPLSPTYCVGTAGNSAGVDLSILLSIVGLHTIKLA